MKLKKLSEVWKRSENITLFLLSLGLFIYGLNLFWLGFHSFDSAQNLIFLRDDINMDLLKNNISYTMGNYVETTTKGYKLTLEESYVKGVEEIIYSIGVIIGSTFVMGYYFKKLEEKK